MFHLELRQSPHKVNRFNLDQAGLWALLEPWVHEQVVELGERRWSPHEATITVLEGPEIPLGRLTMGRGWRAAERESRDVTQHVLAQARAATTSAAAGAAGAAAAAAPAAGADLAAGVQLAALLGPDAVRLLGTWSEVAATTSGLTPSETLALAERNLADGGGARSSGGAGGG